MRWDWNYSIICCSFAFRLPFANGEHKTFLGADGDVCIIRKQWSSNNNTNSKDPDICCCCCYCVSRRRTLLDAPVPHIPQHHWRDHCVSSHHLCSSLVRMNEIKNDSCNSQINNNHFILWSLWISSYDIVSEWLNLYKSHFYLWPLIHGPPTPTFLLYIFFFVVSPRQMQDWRIVAMRRTTISTLVPHISTG